MRCCLPPRIHPRLGAVLLVFSLLAALAVAEAGPPVSRDLLDTGYRIYALGILPDGLPLRATRPEGYTLEGRSAACVTCHRHSGMGSVEGLLDRTILVPPVAGALLFAPSRFEGTFLDPSHHYLPNASWTRVLTRRAYDEPSLARALREGLDPGGNPLLAPMPRYDLDASAVASLAAYLRSLSAEPAPGVTADALHLASVITPDASPGQADAILGVLRAWSASARGAGKAWRLHEWELSGPSDTWDEQLEARYREQPVFAVLSGAGGAEWTPVHRFCEDHRLPCILPSVELAPQDKEGYYSLYYSPGVALEARVLAIYLDGPAATGRSFHDVVQVFSDATGRDAAGTLRAHLGAGAGKVIDRRYRPTAPLAALEGLTGEQVLILWLRTDEIAQLVESLPQGPASERVFLSDLLAPSEAVSLPPEWKRRVSYVSMFDDLGLQGEIARMRLKRWLEQTGLPHDGGLRLQADAYTACYLLNMAISEIRAQEVRRPPVPLSREHVLEMLEVLTSKYSDGTGLVDPDSHVTYYGRMSLGPGQRVAVRGGAVLRYASPESGKLVAVSERIVP
jgi:hypothetical protein